MIKVITADSSAVIRSVEKQIFSLTQDFEFLGSVGDASSLLEKSKTCHPDLIISSNDILDLNKTLKEISQTEKSQIIILDNNSSEKNSFLGVSNMEKPDFISMSPKKMEDFVHSIKTLYILSSNKQSEVGFNKFSYDSSIFFKPKPFEVLLIGVSTGGPKTLQSLLESLGQDFPLPILITQHIDSTFDKNMVSWLNKTLKISASLAEQGEVVKKGHVYFAPADCHLTVKKLDNQVYIRLDKSEPINFLRPAVDKMFSSAAEVYKQGCLAVLLTGMGSDGTVGCEKIKKAGGFTIGESEETCVIFGMPKSALEAGVIDEMLPLYEIGNRVKEITQRRCK